MLKQLIYRRHSIKDGAVKNHIGPNGIALAKREAGISEPVDILFHGELPRTAETALAFASGLPNNPRVAQAIEGVGNDALFADMVTDDFRAAAKGGASNFDALKTAHAEDVVIGWTKQAMQAVDAMFEQIEDGEVGVVFGHSPVAELVALAILDMDEARLKERGLDKLGEMEGFVISLGEAGYLIEKKITVEPLAD